MVYRILVDGETYDIMNSMKNSLTSHSAIRSKYVNGEKCYALHTSDGEIILDISFLFSIDDIEDGSTSYIVSDKSEYEIPTIVYKNADDALWTIAEKIRNDSVCLVDAPTIDTEKVLLDTLLDYIDDRSYSNDTKIKIAKLLKEEIESDI